jgi:hypothetical protein
MNIARLKAVTGESVEIHFSIDPYAGGVTINGQRYMSTPGGGGTWAIDATDIRVSLDVPPNRPLPDRVLVKMHADREFQSALERQQDRCYSGQLGGSICIRSGSRGQVFPEKQEVEFVLIRGGHEETLVDPINQSTRFQIDLYQASVIAGLSLADGLILLQRKNEIAESI